MRGTFGKRAAIHLVLLVLLVVIAGCAKRMAGKFVVKEDKRWYILLRSDGTYQSKTYMETWKPGTPDNSNVIEDLAEGKYEIKGDRLILKRFEVKSVGQEKTVAIEFSELKIEKGKLISLSKGGDEWGPVYLLEE